MSTEKEAGNSLPQVFNYTDIPIHVKSIEAVPWFAAKDVCHVLSIKEPHRAVSGLDDDERQVLTGVDSRGRKNRIIYVNESGMYGLTFRSNKPEAKKFRKWVTNEVLPSIRKTGNYQVTSKRNFSEDSNRLKNRYVELPEYKPLIEMVDKATLVCGSQEQLAKRLGTTNSVLSLLHRRPWLVSDEKHRAIELGCRNLLGRNGKLDTEALEQLLAVDDREVRISLYKKMQKGGLL